MPEKSAKILSIALHGSNIFNEKGELTPVERFTGIRVGSVDERINHTGWLKLNPDVILPQDVRIGTAVLFAYETEEPTDLLGRKIIYRGVTSVRKKN